MQTDRCCCIADLCITLTFFFSISLVEANKFYQTAFIRGKMSDFGEITLNDCI